MFSNSGCKFTLIMYDRNTSRATWGGGLPLAVIVGMMQVWNKPRDQIQERALKTRQNLLQVSTIHGFVTPDLTQSASETRKVASKHRPLRRRLHLISCHQGGAGYASLSLWRGGSSGHGHRHHLPRGQHVGSERSVRDNHGTEGKLRLVHERIDSLKCGAYLCLVANEASNALSLINTKPPQTIQ